MKYFVLSLVLAVCVAAQAATFGKPAVPMYKLIKNSNSSKIINGQPAKQGQFPWQVELRVGGMGLCGGSLISSSWVLTAAHCVAASFWEIKVGGIIRGVNDEPGSVITTARTTVRHENYDSNNLNNDIALIKLSEDIPLTENIQPIRLPSRSDVDDRLENVQLTISGYGKTGDWEGVSNRLMYVNLNTITNDECAAIYGDNVIISSTLCTEAGPDAGTCNGDSGGPLIRIAEDGIPTQVGIVSFGSILGCESGDPSGFVRTASFLDWINEKTGIPIRD